jgi:hypothetical protein
MHVRHNSGREIKIRFAHGMYRADVDGIHYCSQSVDGVLYGIGKRHSISVDVPIEIPRQKEVYEVVCQSDKFSEKQEALQFVLDRASRGCQPSQKIVAKLCRNIEKSAETANAIAAELSRPEMSGSRIHEEAKRVTQKLNKKDLAYVTHNELTENIPDVVLRNGVMRLLIERYSFDGD